MTLIQLRYLVAIADAHLNITLAAEHMHATQPGLSRQLKQLEEELGFLLFVRKGRSLDAITPAGAEIIGYARSALSEVENIRTYSANQRGDLQGRLVIVTTHTQARFVLPPVIAQIKRRYPQVSVHLQPANENDARDILAQGQADIALVSKTVGHMPNEGIAVPLYRWRRLLLMPPDHPLAQGQLRPDIQALAAQPLISYDSSNAQDSSIRQAFAKLGLVPNIAMTAQDADLIKRYVREGLGIGILAEMAVHGSERDLWAWVAPAEIAECVAWAVLPRERVLRDYTQELVHQLAPQINKQDLRRVLDGNQQPDWPEPPMWETLTQTITV